MNKLIDRYVKLAHKLGQGKVSEKNETGCYMINNDQLYLIMNPKYLTADVIRQNTGANVTVISNKEDSHREQITNAYGFKSYVIHTKNPVLLFEACVQTLLFMMKYSNGNLPKAKIGDVLVGDLIYDSIIMRQKGKYTIHSLWNVVSFKEILKTYLIYKEIKKTFGKNRPKYLIAQDLVYRDALYSRMASHYGAEVIVLTTGRPSYVFKTVQDEQMNYDEIYAEQIREKLTELPDNWENEADEMLGNLFKGQGDWNAANAYKDKTFADRDSILNELKIYNGKKNVVIMAHCFSDAPHRTGGMLHKDYYDWLEKTLAITADNPQVNWILKPHPGRMHYGEEGAVEALFERYKTSNLHWMPEKFSTLVIKEFADCIVTVNGSAGLELSCLGIPCINAGVPFYAHFDYTKAPRTEEAYKELLMNIQNISSLDTEQITMAKKVFYAFKKIILNDKDEFACRSFAIHQAYVKNGNLEEANHCYLDLLEEFVDKERMSSTYDIEFMNDYLKV